eukprot:SAG25_NODE_446_length_7952_cov_2.827116_9_plen_188_part_00
MRVRFTFLKYSWRVLSHSLTSAWRGRCVSIWWLVQNDMRRSSEYLEEGYLLQVRRLLPGPKSDSVEIDATALFYGEENGKLREQVALYQKQAAARHNEALLVAVGRFWRAIILHVVTRNHRRSTMQISGWEDRGPATGHRACVYAYETNNCRMAAVHGSNYKITKVFVRKRYLCMGDNIARTHYKYQ